LRGIEEEEWNSYIASLGRIHVIIKEESDSLLWSKNLEGGLYIPKVGYKVLCKSGGGRRFGDLIVPLR